VSYGYRPSSLGKPSIAYEPKAGQVRTTVAQGKGDSKLSANFAFRPPMLPPGLHTMGEQGSFVDARA
jgi:hypothetical protein